MATTAPPTLTGNEREAGSAGREALAIAAATFLGAVLRLWGLGGLGLSHFDEGAYASVGLWVSLPGGLGGMDPDILSYAPPGFLMLVGVAYLLVGFVDLAPILVSQVAGIAAIPVVGALARRILGPGAGAAAAFLAALAGAHVAFSRLALTDTLFLLGWILAMWAGAAFLERPGLGRAVLLGLCIGLTQNLKYNGWLAGVVVGLALAAGWTRPGADLKRGARDAALLALALGIAGLLYLPWFRFVETHGSYARLVAHHRAYVDGPAAWPANLRTQLAQVAALSGGWRWLAAGWLLAWAACRWVRNAFEARPAVARSATIALAGAVLLSVWPAAAWWIPLAALPWLLRSPSPSIRLLGAWWAFLSALTPLYHPYARLWLPLHAAGWLVLAGLQARADTSSAGPPAAAPRRRTLAWVGSVLLLGVAASFAAGPRARPLDGLLTRTSALREGLKEYVCRPLPPGVGIIRALARPQVTYYLGLLRSPPFMVYRDLDSLLTKAAPGDWLLVDEVLLRQEPDPGAALRRLHAACAPEPVGQWVEPLSPPVLLDVAPGAAYGDESARRSRWWLLAFRGEPAAAFARPESRRAPPLEGDPP